MQVPSGRLPTSTWLILVYEVETKEKHGIWDPLPEVDYILTLSLLQSRLHHIKDGQPESTLTLCQSRLYPPSQGLGIWPLPACLAWNTFISLLILVVFTSPTHSATVQRQYDMNMRLQMQEGNDWILPNEMNANRFFWDSHWLEIWFKGTIAWNGFLA